MIHLPKSKSASVYPITYFKAATGTLFMQIYLIEA